MTTLSCRQTPPSVLVALLSVRTAFVASVLLESSCPGPKYRGRYVQTGTDTFASHGVEADRTGGARERVLGS